MTRSVCSSAGAASGSRGQTVHPTPPPLPPALCYLCGGGTVRTWVVEDEGSLHLGKRFYKCPRFHETRKEACRFGFMWHDDYRLILEGLGVIPARAGQIQMMGNEAASSQVLLPRRTNQIGATSQGRQQATRGACDGGGIILKAILAISAAQLLIAIAIYCRI